MEEKRHRLWCLYHLVVDHILEVMKADADTTSSLYQCYMLLLGCNIDCLDLVSRVISRPAPVLRQKLITKCLGNTKLSMLVMFGNISLAYLSLKRCHARGGKRLKLVPASRGSHHAGQKEL